jgi:hypothetical protein
MLSAFDQGSVAGEVDPTLFLTRSMTPPTRLLKKGNDLPLKGHRFGVCTMKA